MAKFETRDAREATLELKWEPERGPWVIHVGEDSARTVTLTQGESMVLGSAVHADLRVADRCVSGTHCRLEAVPGGVVVEDLGSTNGVLLGQGRVTRALIGTGGAFVVGQTLIAIERPEHESPPLGARGKVVPGLVGTSHAMRRVALDVHRCAALRAPVLIHGESGTGKDVVARAIHELGHRRGAHVPLNVGAIAESLVDAELFGHRRGAFTGAVESRAGAFEQAHGGTLFLDEVGELSAAGQVRLLRVIEDGLVRPVGASQPLAVDVRLVSATWANLPALIQAGRFRGDLYHRLSTFIIELPPLRARKGDIAALSRTLLERHRGELGDKSLSASALARLLTYDWPGNVRELSSVLYRAAARAEEQTIQARHLDFNASSAPARCSLALSPADALRLVERHGGNVSAAARAGGVPRSTLRSWLAQASHDGGHHR